MARLRARALARRVRCLPPDRQPAHAPLRRCPHAGRGFQVGWTVCPYCARDVEPRSSSGSIRRPTPEAIKKAFRKEIARYHPTRCFTWAPSSRGPCREAPVIMLLFARVMAPQHEISKANETNARPRKTPDGPDEIAVVAVGTSDWSGRLPPNWSKEVQKLANTFCQ